jgi:hypothetical protein
MEFEACAKICGFQHVFRTYHFTLNVFRTTSKMDGTLKQLYLKTCANRCMNYTSHNLHGTLNGMT